MRLNIGIDPKNLSDEHLYAESRELKFLPSYFARYGMKSINKVPPKFTLGEGHILFFVYKPTYTLNRYKKVIEECIKRNIKVKDESYRWNVYKDLEDDFKEDGSEHDIIVNRVIDRIQTSPEKYFHYYHNKISKEDLIKMLV